MSKYIFVTGGVVSSVGKGITVASIGRLLKSRGLKVSVQKLDPYLNVDPGTMSPYQHGEVFVTDDGAETDLDLGHYERFIDVAMTCASNVTTGQIYNSVITKERRGEFLGGTIQIVPHVTNEIKSRIRFLAQHSQADVLIVEVGGTVGDMEGLPFLESIRQMRHEEGRDNVLFVHVTLLPFISSTQELKTKPTQHSVNELRRIGIQPDVILCRSDIPMAENLKDKISLFCDVEKRAVIPLPTVPVVYDVPIMLEQNGLGNILMEKLKLDCCKVDMSEWQTLVERLKKPKETVSIAMVGKYMELWDAYLSIREALCHAATFHDKDVKISHVSSEEMEREGPNNLLRTAQGILVPGGFGNRGIEGMIMAARYARENKIPYFGLCLGMQVMAIEFARFMTGSEEANSTEFNPDTRYPVIDLMPDQRNKKEKGATMRLGAYPCRLVPGTRAASSYKTELIHERHRHRYEFNNSFKEMFSKGNMVFSGLSPDGELVEIIELSGHPWMLGTQFHPEFKSRPTRPHPLFLDFIEAANNTMREGAQPPLPLGLSTR